MKERKRNGEDVILRGSKIIQHHISTPVDDRPSECKNEQSVSLVVNLPPLSSQPSTGKCKQPRQPPPESSNNGTAATGVLNDLCDVMRVYLKNVLLNFISITFAAL